MTAADWVIVAVMAVSVIQAAISGFFHEAFGIAGLVLGYLLAAWNYQRLAARFAPHMKSMWLGEIAAFLIIFLAVLFLAGIAGTDCPPYCKRSGTQFCGPDFGRGAGAAARKFDCGSGPDEHGSVHADVDVAGRFGTGAVFPGSWARRHLGGAVGIAVALLSRTRFAAP